MDKLLEKILESGKVEDDKGFLHPLHSHTKRDQCDFLQNLIAKVKPVNSLEIGLAYGISTLAILDALKNVGTDFHHIVIDPYQDKWGEIGLLNISKAGFSNKITFYKKFSDQVIPKLYYEDYKIQFAYIDSTKVFDVLMTDIYFINKILDINGLLVLDDCGFPGIRLLVRFLMKHPSFELYDRFGKDKHSKKVRFVNWLYLKGIGLLPFKSKALPNYNFVGDEAMGLNFNCLAFQKIKEDDRRWDWNERF